MKVCFIGACGHWRQALRYLKTRNDVVFCGFAPGSKEENRVSSIDDRIPFFEDYCTMLDMTKPDLAVVSPVFGLTGKVVLACAERGVDVFAEKPVAATFEELEQVKAAVTRCGIRFCAMHYLRFTPSFYHAAQMVRSGKIGKVQMLTAQKSYKYGVRPAWYGDPGLYCGTIPWVGIHAMDWIAHFSGKRFVNVTAKNVGENPEMAALCQFDLEDDVIASVNIDFYRPETAPTHGDDRIRCVGTKGILEVIGDKILLTDQAGVSEYHPNTAPDLLAEFLDGKDPLPMDEIFHITETAIKARDAARTGKTVYIGDPR